MPLCVCRVLPQARVLLSLRKIAFRAMSSDKDSSVMQEVERVMASPELMAKLPETDVSREVSRVMAEPEINGQPVLLNFAKGEKTKGYSRTYAAAYDRIFAKKKDP
jgi:hypothetical protein